jgi:hypothetical protein
MKHKPLSISKNVMKKTPVCLFASLLIFSAAARSYAQPVFTLDSGQTINDYVSLGEFNGATSDGWGDQPSGATQSSVANGFMTVTTLAGDPWIYRQNLADLTTELNIVEVRLRLLKGTPNDWELFWGQTGAGGFAASRRLGFSTGIGDTEFHLLQFDYSGAFTAGESLIDLRFDIGQDAGAVVDIDYIRVGRVAPDSDGDGLPDNVETGTGIYVSPRDTGTKPNVADSDGDGVNDGTEVTYGTNPNDSASFPVPTIERYSLNPAAYIVGTEITANTPSVIMGTPTGYTISPALPAGLQFSATDGSITGTPTTAREATDYTVVATFSDGQKATNTLHLTVAYPHLSYLVTNYVFKVNSYVNAFAPEAVGTAPQAYAISPSLPDGLDFDPGTGEISGTPTTYTATATYTVSATYEGSPAATIALAISVVEDPIETIDPSKTMAEYVSLGEFAEATDAAGWGSVDLEPLTVDGGSLVVNTTGGDPYIVKNLALENDYKILEFRMKVVTGAEAQFRTYWSEAATGRGMSEATTFLFPEIAQDGEYHVYQIDYTRATVAKFDAIRLDPSTASGNSYLFDYIRLGSFTVTVKPSLKIAVQANQTLRVSWPTAAAGYTLQSTVALPGGWTADPATVSTQDAESYVEIPLASAPKFYRLVK